MGLIYEFTKTESLENEVDNTIPKLSWIDYRNLGNPEIESQHIPTYTTPVNMKEGVNPEIHDTSWIDYRNNWNGTILIKSDSTKLILTDQYREAMRRKGAHPLTQLYPQLLDHTNTVRNNCLKVPGAFSNEITTSSGVYIYFNDDYEVVNCAIPKVSSTMWGIEFARMINSPITLPKETRDKFRLTNVFTQYSKTARCMQTYTKFFIYRHPFERLVSAYYDKFTLASQVWYVGKFGRDIITVNYLNDNTQGSKYSELSLETKTKISNQQNRLKLPHGKYNITFLEFVTYIASFLDKNAVQDLDLHWRPISLQCNPCAVDYDIVIDHEFVVEESQILADYLQKNKKSNPPINFVKEQRRATRDKCNQIFRDIPQNLREKLHKIYLTDFILFGYNYNGDSHDYACDENIAK
ncbi:Carbohydrate sulfotransferase 11 [Oopsacas minuta]|uniref:Carbohydrate sulfotransferase n=1 Tax=Oopsacas minuta TaxID=111878 RepID=A0AAV7KCN5_9METZ|nr:Carbohydrate sulfotransferase 11 [Oopsacas minuta]